MMSRIAFLLPLLAAIGCPPFTHAGDGQPSTGETMAARDRLTKAIPDARVVPWSHATIPGVEVFTVASWAATFGVLIDG